jgi:sulfate transport system ATP-binding protein
MSIELRNINKSFGTFKALEGIDLVVSDGELTALLGPSGSGKTTLLRIIAGLEHPDVLPGSEIRFFEENVAGRPAGKRQVGFVFQHYALFRHMTVFENIAFGLRVKPREERLPERKIKKKVRELLELIQLENLENRYPSQLSGGQRQRVALARALAITPKLLLLDEPFGALDAKVRQDLRSWLRQLHEEIHVTSVFVTHDQEEALELADRVVVMNQGRIEQIGTPDEVFHNPANAFVVNFLGSINLFHGRLEQDRSFFSGLMVDHLAGELPEDGEGRLFVRPHDIDILPRPTHPDQMCCRIIRVHTAGAVVKIDLASARGSIINVEMTHEKYAAAGVGAGDDVYLRIRDAYVFEGSQEHRKTSRRKEETAPA